LRGDFLLILCFLVGVSDVLMQKVVWLGGNLRWGKTKCDSFLIKSM